MGSIPVRVRNDAAAPADEQALVHSVTPVDVLALEAHLRRVRRIDVHQRDARPAGLVDERRGPGCWTGR